MRAVFLVILALAATALSQQISYKDYKVYRITPKTEDEVKVVKVFEKLTEDFDFWKQPRDLNQSMDVMVSPRYQNLFVAALSRNKIQFKVLIADVEELPKDSSPILPRIPQGRIAFDRFHRYGAIETYLKQLQNDYPDIVKVSYPGISSENRPIAMIEISTDPSKNKPVILVDGGIHAREWAAPATVLYIIQELVENPENRHLIENVDWRIIPVLNPDGYEYSHTSDRYWRKTRSVGQICYGTDANRNFGFHWMEIGASDFECDETYGGPSAMSEPETGAIKNMVDLLGSRIKLYLTFHSYGEYLLYPWGYTSNVPENSRELQSLGESVAAAIRQRRGTRYTIGSSTNVLYAAAGGSDDYVMGVGNVNLAYTIELPGNGFVLPPSEILPVVQETWDGIKVYHQYVESKYVN